jgi:hypothetical protein
MAFLEQDAKNIASGWGPEPKLEAPGIGPTLAAILLNRRQQQQQTQEALTAAIKAQQSRNQDAAFAQALQNTGLTEGQDVSGLSGEQLSRMAQLLADRTPDTDLDAMHKAAAARDQAAADAIKNGTYGTGRGGGVPRYDYNGVLLPGSEYLKRKDQDRAAQTVGELSAQEADAQARATQYEKKYGVDTDAGGLKAPGWGADQATKDQFARDQADYFKAYQDLTKARTQRQNYEKWYRGTLQPGGTTPGGTPDDDTDSGTTAPPAPPPAQPQTSATPPPQTGASPAPTGTPRPGVKIAPGYGVPPGGAGGAQTGQLVPGQSRRMVGGKWWVWDGNQWQPE